MTATDPNKLQVQTARSGVPTACYAERMLHSAYDPVREAEQWAEQVLREKLRERSLDQLERIVLLGSGLGYAIDAMHSQLCARGETVSRFICIEAIPEILESAKQLRVWETSTQVDWLSLYDDRIEIEKLYNESQTTLVLSAQASYEFAAREYESLISKQSSSGKSLRILVPTPLYGGSLPAANHSAEALRELGHKVELFDLQSFFPMYNYAAAISRCKHRTRELQNLLVEFLAGMIVERAIDSQADLVWSVAQTPLTPQALARLRKEQILSAFWFVEDWRLFPYWRQVCSGYDAVFTIQKGEFHQALKQHGAAQVHYLPCAANPQVHYPQQIESPRWQSDVSFMGAGYPNRLRLFDELNLPNFKIWGNDWPKESPVYRYVQDNGRRVESSESRLIYNGTKINLNLHSSVTIEENGMQGDFVNPRTFEIAACEGFQLVDERSLMGEMFDSKSELATFKNSSELPGLIEYYMSNDTERAAIAKAGYERVLHEHTYVHRMRAALEFLNERVIDNGAAIKTGYIDTMLNAAGQDAELIKLLKRFQSDPHASLDTITDSIELGKKPLSRAEGILLLMREFRDWGRQKGVIA